jgi:dipeptidyl aminopeptidase/acylaminoacyl peptidase
MGRSTTKGSSLWLASLDGSKSKRLVEAESNVAFVPDAEGSTGYLLYAHQSTLSAQRLDLGRGELVRGPVVITDNITSDLSPRFAFSVSMNGSLAYRTGPSAVTTQLVWVDRQGRKIRTVGDPGLLHRPRLSPDGSRIVVWNRADSRMPPRGDLWVIDMSSNAALRFTLNELPKMPVWSPDGSRIAFTELGTGGGARYVSKASSGAGPEEELPGPPSFFVLTDWASNGQLLYSDESGDASADIWMADFKLGSKAAPYIRAPRKQVSGRFSPDSQWVAYASDQSGQFEIYIQRAASNQARWQISNLGGTEPVWRANGKELFYLAPDGKLMAVEIRFRNDGLDFSIPKALFESGLKTSTFASAGLLNVSGDGEHFLLNREVGGEPPANVTIVLNWAETLRK